MAYFGIENIGKVRGIVHEKSRGSFRVISDRQIRANHSEYLVLEIEVPAYCVGSLIGKGGEAIKRVSIPC